MSQYLFKGATIYRGTIGNGHFELADILVQDGVIREIAPSLSIPENDNSVTVISADQCFIFPGLIDVHVHFRDPGFLYKENMETGSMAAAHGGFTSVLTMPNLNPVPDSVEHLSEELQSIRDKAKVHVYPYGAITVGEKGEELADLEGMAKDAIAFSDDGKGVQDEAMMRTAMEKTRDLGKILVAHCEVNDLLKGGYIHDGEYARLHGHKGICSASEYEEIRRDIRLSEETGCPYHVCHVSAKESVQLIREAKARGANVTAETGPHYLVMNDMMLQEDGRFKMNPPIRSEEDRVALLEGIKDGTLDMIITDHAPHSAEEKSRGLAGSLMGVVGLETSLAVMYTFLVKTGELTLEDLMKLMHDNPKARFGVGTDLEVGEKADLTVFDLNASYTVDPDEFLSMGKATPFKGVTLCGKCRLTMVDGTIVWEEN